MTSRSNKRAINGFAVAKLFGGLLILVASIAAFQIRGAVSKVADMRTDAIMSYALLPLKQGATDEERKAQLERIKWNYLTGKVDEVYLLTGKKSFIDEYSDRPWLFWMTAGGGVLLLVGEMEHFRK